ncbi:hypothetical protein CBR_g66778 [Chara braunii]|uniref:K Homology domain-containing protein n=1 Tax=Chara braunii TaxID=69332 RepID=A0A388K9E1_CHABU|nr:hypothetical protein CBR_g66778 [Chara braunii]|eukprot:GBG66641.1 hypothetical protein CBR_g66778 [Chara braunii]
MTARYLPGLGSGSLTMRPDSAPRTNDRYLATLLAERQNLSPFVEVLPNCSRLLNQEIARVTSLMGNAAYHEADGLDQGGLGAGSLMQSGGSLSSAGIISSGPGAANDYGGSHWGPVQGDPLPILMGPGGSVPQVSPFWGAQGAAAGPLVRKTRRIDVPVDKHPNYNFVGRLLGPRGNSLKRVESTTGCRVLIRGRGSIKDSGKEDKMRDKPGFEHLNEPLHVLIEAELPASTVDASLNQAAEIIEELLKPVDENYDVVKKAQLRELAILNGTLREDSGPYYGGSAANSAGLKRAKTRR